MQEAPFTNKSYPLALTYINWETDAIVGIELIRNVGIALGGTKWISCFAFDSDLFLLSQHAFS